MHLRSKVMMMRLGEELKEEVEMAKIVRSGAKEFKNNKNYMY